MKLGICLRGIIFVFLGFLCRRQAYASAENIQERASAYDTLCVTVFIEHVRELDFTAMERRLVCGDTGSGLISEPWSSVPPNQAAFFMRGFLQTRGYHQPAFTQNGKTLWVKVGPISRLNEFHILNGPLNWDPPVRRLVQDAPMTPALLDDLQSWSIGQIKNEGYPCAGAKAQGDPLKGEVNVTLNTDSLRTITSVQSTGDSGLQESALNRYNAFRIGDIYRDDLIQLTRTRTQQDGILQTLILNPRCDPNNGVTIVRNIELGPPRSVSVGVGGSTDVGAEVRAAVGQGRIGDLASSAQTKINASYLNDVINHQVLAANYRWYYSSVHERSYLQPSITFEHDAEVSFELQSIESKLLHTWNQEWSTGQVTLQLGPTYLASLQPRGPGPEQSSVLIAEGDMKWLAHGFEFFAASPRRGEYLNLNVLVTQQRWGANFTAQRLQLQGQKLWDIGRFDPPLLILATRFNLSSVFSSDPQISSNLPVRFLTFIGGDSDLRGFDRQSLPRSGVGALAGATGSIEARLHKVIYRRADIFSFIDAGALGSAGFHLEDPIFMSPGVGLRWESPVGVLRGYVAQRFALQEKPSEPAYGRDWRLGFTFGQEF